MIIGITGGIGSGKSVISKELRRMGYEVYDTDNEAKRLIVENVQIRRNIEDLLGKEVYKDNVYQTQIVASKVFANKSLLVQLNAILFLLCLIESPVDGGAWWAAIYGVTQSWTRLK